MNFILIQTKGGRNYITSKREAKLLMWDDAIKKEVDESEVPQNLRIDISELDTQYFAFGVTATPDGQIKYK